MPASGPAITVQNTAARKPNGLLSRAVDELRFFLKLGAVMLALLTLVWGHYKIPSESMQPTLEVGDHIYVSKFAYGYSRHSLPFGLHRLALPNGRIFSRLPERGDIVVFRNPNNGTVMIKRAVGLPGDEIAVTGGRLIVNGSMVDRTIVGELMYRMNDNLKTVAGATEYDERLPGAEVHRIFEHRDNARNDNTDLFVVPQGHIFFMGDNRDRSTDSRVGRLDRFGMSLPPAEAGPGFVPLQNLIGRADVLMFTFNRCNRDEGLRCPPRGRAPSRL